MGRIRSTRRTIYRSDVSSAVVELPEHQTGDFLRILICKDDANGGTLSTPSGWTKLGGVDGSIGGIGNNTIRGAVFYKVAASASEEYPEITSTDADTWSAIATAYEGISGIGATVGPTARATGNPYTANGVLTTATNSIVEFLIVSDGSVAQQCPPGRMMIQVADDGGSACAAAFVVQKAIGASADCGWIANGTADESVVWTLELLDSSGSTIMPGYPNLDCATLVHPFNGLLPYTGDSLDDATDIQSYNHLAGAWENPLTVLRVSNGGATIDDLTAAATNATDADVDPVVAVEGVGDFIAFRFGSTPLSMRWDRAGCTAGVGGAFAKEYLVSGGVWKTLPEHYDQTGNLNASVGDHQLAGWTAPADWTDQTFNSLTGRWWRWRLTTLFTTNPTVSQIFVNAKRALVFDALGARDRAGATPDYDSMNCTPGITGNIFNGSALDLAATKDLSAVRLMSTFILDSPADVQDNSSRAEGGMTFGLIDSSNKLRMWTVAANDQLDTYHQKRGIFTIQTNQSVSTEYDSTAPDLTVVKKILLAHNCKYGGPNASYNPLIALGTLKIYGGTATNPLGFDDVVAVANGYPCPMIDSITNTCYTLLQIGGDDPVHLVVDGKTLIWPAQATAANKLASRHVDAGVLGFLIDVRAGDTLHLTNCTWESGAADRWEALVTASASADCMITGKVVNKNVILRPICDWGGLQFVNCPSFTQNASTIDGCTFINTKITSDDPGGIHNNSFTSGGTGHAVEITTPCTCPFSGNTFAGYGADGTTDAAIYNNSGGAVTLKIAGGNQVPTVRNGAGATTSIVVECTFTGIPSGTGEVLSLEELDGSGDPLVVPVFLRPTIVAGTATVDLKPNTKYAYVADALGYYPSDRLILDTAVSSTAAIRIDEIVDALGNPRYGNGTPAIMALISYDVGDDDIHITYSGTYPTIDYDSFLDATEQIYTTHDFIESGVLKPTYGEGEIIWPSTATTKLADEVGNTGTPELEFFPHKIGESTAYSMMRTPMYTTYGLHYPSTAFVVNGGFSDADATNLSDVKKLIRADEIHNKTLGTITKVEEGTANVLLTKNFSGTPLKNFQAVD